MSTAVIAERRTPRDSGVHYTPSAGIEFELRRCRTVNERVGVVWSDAHGILTALAERRLRDRSLAEDAVNGGYELAAKKLEQMGEQQEPIETLGSEDLFRILMGQTDKWVSSNNRSGRSASREREALSNAGDGAGMLAVADEGIEDPTEHVHHKQIWSEWFALLSERNRRIFDLDRSGLHRRDIATRLSLSEKAVKKALEDIARRACDFEQEVFRGAICEEFREHLVLHVAGTLDGSLGKRKASRARIHFTHCTTCRLRMRRTEQGLATIFPVLAMGAVTTGALVVGVGKGFAAHLWGKLAVLNPFTAGAGTSAASAGGGAGISGGIASVGAGIGAKVVAVAAAGTLLVGGGVALVEKATDEPVAHAAPRTQAALAATSPTPASVKVPAKTPVAKPKPKAKAKAKANTAPAAKPKVATPPAKSPAPSPSPAPAPAPPPGPVVGSPEPGLAGP